MIDLRLSSMRAVDAILAILQTAFAQPVLVNGGNPFRFVANDRVNTTLWIADTEGRLSTERGGARMQILVDRTEYIAQDLHLHGFGSLIGNDKRFFTDLGGTNVVIYCEGGNRFQSETLASVVYQIIKAFRQDLMREFDLFNLKPQSIGTAQVLENVTGKPWRTTVVVQVLTQEKLIVTELANHLNSIDIVATYDKIAQARGITRLDTGIVEPGFNPSDSTPPNP